MPQTGATAADGGQLWAWGSNAYGMLGVGTKSEIRKPTSILDMTDVIKVVPNGFTTYAIRANGTVWAWGSNYSGQLGDGTLTDRDAPAMVSNVTAVVDLVVVYDDVYVLRADGTVWTWGSNHDGRARDPRVSDLFGPRAVPGLSKVKSLTTDNYSIWALRADGKVYAWGKNSFGELGDGTTKTRAKPVTVHKLSRVTKILALGWAVFAIRKDHTVWSWGDNAYGQLGTGSKKRQQRVPAAARKLKNMVDITGGEPGKIYGVRRDGTVWTWGGGRRAPKRLAALSGVTKVALGEDTGYALKSDGTVWAWGSNTYGQLGSGAAGGRRSLPAMVPDLADVRDVVAYAYYVMALKADGTVWSWGSEANPLNGRESGNGALGLCGPGHVFSPTRIAGLTQVTQIVSSGWSTFAIGNGAPLTCSQ